jgi:hypothetical protein
VEGELVRARVELGAADHHVAWAAHDQDQPVTLQGVLRRVGRIFRIDDPGGFRTVEEQPAGRPQVAGAGAAPPG